MSRSGSAADAGCARRAARRSDGGRARSRGGPWWNPAPHRQRGLSPRAGGVARPVCGVLALCLAAGAAQAQQRPLLTEDPEPIGDGLVLLEAGVDQTWEHVYPVSGLKGQQLRAPRLGFSFGMGSRGEIQLDAGSISRLVISERFPAPLAHMVEVPGDTTQGWDDAVIGAKVKLANEGGVRPAVGLRFATRLPNASNETGLGLDTMDFFQSLLVGKTVQSIRVVGNVGLGILSDPTRGDRQNDVLTYGLSLARAITAASEIVGEIYGRVNTRRGTPPPGTESRGRMTFGLRYTRVSVRIDAGLFTGLTPLDPKLGVTAGLTWVFRGPPSP